MKRILIIGATSAIAEATARIWAGEGQHLYLVARDIGELTATAADLRTRGAAEVNTAVFDAKASALSLGGTVADAIAALGSIDIALIAHGVLPDQARCEIEPEALNEQFAVNATSVAVLAMQIAGQLARQGHGTLAVIGSVAGDRGRASNFAYGAAKACVETFMEGLRQRYFSRGVNVLIIKPGFVDTPMTAHIPNKNGLIWVRPSHVAKDVTTAIKRGRTMLYTPRFWRWIMTAIRFIPEFAFKRLKL